MDAIENMQSVTGSEEAFGAAIAIILIVLGIFLIFGIAIYIVTSIFMSRLNKRIYGNGTALAWIPFARTFLLGKLAVNKLVGIIYLALSIIGGWTVGSGSDGETTALVPGLGGLVSAATLVLYILAIIKNSKLKKGELSPEQAKAECEAMDFKKHEVKTAQPQPVEANVTVEEGSPTPEQPAPVAKFCSNCGAEIIEGSAFCANCGNKN